MNKKDCKHFGEYGFGNGYFGQKVCKLIDGCEDADECKEIFLHNEGNAVMAFIRNIKKGELAKEQERSDIKEAQRIERQEALDREKERTGNKDKIKYLCEACNHIVEVAEPDKNIKCPKCGKPMSRLEKIDDEIKEETKEEVDSKKEKAPEKKVDTKTRTVEEEYWICPYCKKEIEEKELYHDEEKDKWYHRPCQDKGAILLPEEKKDKCIVKCPECGNTFDMLAEAEAGVGYVKCPKCEAPVTQKDVVKEEDKKKFNCECIKCGHKIVSDKHCKDLKCDECGGQMRREGRPGPGQEKE